MILKKLIGSRIVIISLILPIFLSKDQSPDGHANQVKEFESKSEYPSEWFDYQRTYPYGELNQKNYLDAMKQVMEKQRKSDITINWEFVGPTNIGGRISDIEIHPNTETTIYVGAASGGIFKSSDNGLNWENIFASVPTIGIGDIAIDPNNEQVLYAGTGEANASSNTFLGSGIYKSIDAGNTWNNIGLENTAYIGRIIVDYNNSSRLFVAACGNLFTKNNHRGIYRSNNAGDTWEQVLFVTDSTSGIDIVQHPADPDTLYAAMWERVRGLDYRRSFGNSSGIYKTIDGGDTWTELTVGLPTESNVGRIGLSISETNPNVLYAFYDKSDFVSQVFKSIDGGNTWTQTNDSPLSQINSNFGWYFGQIRVDPENENKVYAMGQYFFDSDNGGSSWAESGYEMHVDHHAIEFTSNRIWEGNDGGLYYSTTNGSSWIKVNTLPLTQFYDIALDSTYTDRLYGGTQDNNSIRTVTGNADDWEYLLGGDGMHCLVDYSNPNTYYCEYQYGGVYRFEGSNSYYIGFYGDRTNWSTPYIMHPDNPNILYLGTYQVYKSTNKGDNWTPISGDLTKGGSDYFHTLTTLDISVLNPQIIMTGSADGKVYITTNEGGQWTDISAGLPDRWITNVKADRFDENKLYATVSGFRWDEHYSHVYRSTDLGQNWEAIGDDLPEIPVNVLIQDPDVEGRLFVGTDAGIYMTNDHGANWHCISENIPNAPVMAMEFHHATRTLYAGTYGVSAYKAFIPKEMLGINDLLSDDQIEVFPNPIKSGDILTFKIQASQNGEIDYTITDITGKSIFRSHLILKNRNGLFLLNTYKDIGKQLVPGTYFLCLEIDQKSYVKKIIVN